MATNRKNYSMPGVLVFTLLASLVFPSDHSQASENGEINFLLSYIAESGCLFIRNGKKHKPDKAKEHLEMKYNRAKGRIQSAEDFIDKIATKSSFTGRSYKVICGDVKSSTKDWLEAALSRHRRTSQH